MAAKTLSERFRAARRDPALAVLEGLHAIKHALRFDAELIEVITRDRHHLARICAELAPDLVEPLSRLASEAPSDLFDALAPQPPGSGVIALARRPRMDPREPLDAAGAAPLVLLESPGQHGNVGAVVRVAAAAGAAGVLTLGGVDPWHPAALRGAAGLHFALPVAPLTELPPSARPLLALDPDGEPLDGPLPAGALIAFGSERHGLSDALLDRADLRLRLPMRPGVSSLNLATSVAAVLYGARARPDGWSPGHAGERR